MAIPILPLPAGNTGLMALTQGFSRGLQNAGQMASNRMANLMAEAQQTKNQYLAPALQAANQLSNEQVQQLAIQNQYSPAQYQAKISGENLQNQLLKGQVGFQPQEQQAQLASENAQTGLANTRANVMANPAVPTQNYMQAYANSVKETGANSPQSLALQAGLVKMFAVPNYGMTTMINPQVGPNGVMPGGAGMAPGNNPALGSFLGAMGGAPQPQGAPAQTVGANGVQMAPQQAPMAQNGMSQVAPALSPNAATAQQPIIGQSGVAGGSPVSMRTTAGTSYYTVDPQTGKINYASVSTLPSVTATQGALRNDQNALSNITSIYSGEKGEVGGLPGILKQGAQSAGELLNINSPGLNKLGVAQSNVTPAAAGFLAALGVHPSVAAMEDTKENIEPDNTKTLAYNRARLANYTVNTAVRQFQNKEYLKYGYNLQNQPLLDTNELQSYVDTQLQQGTPMNQLASNLYNYMALQIPSSFPNQAAKMQWYNSQPDNVKPLIQYKVRYQEGQAAQQKKGG